MNKHNGTSSNAREVDEKKKKSVPDLLYCRLLLRKIVVPPVLLHTPTWEFPVYDARDDDVTAASSRSCSVTKTSPPAPAFACLPPSFFGQAKPRENKKFPHQRTSCGRRWSEREREREEVLRAPCLSSCALQAVSREWCVKR